MKAAEPTDRYGPEPTRDEVAAMPGPMVLVFGTNWCGHCAAVEPHLAAVMPSYPEVRLIRVEDGRGRPLGRSFGVKLWPTLVFLRDGEEVGRAVRPGPGEIAAGLSALVARPGTGEESNHER